MLFVLLKMQHSLDQFLGNIKKIRDMHALYVSMRTRVTGVIDISDFLRAEIVMLVSALDHYIHEITRVGMVESYEGRRIRTNAFNNFSVTLGSVTLNSGEMGTSWLEEEIRKRHSFVAFQQPDKIADAIRLFSDVKLWESVSKNISRDRNDLTIHLKVLIGRRNKIAHEADIDPSFPGARWPIDVDMVEEAIDFVSTLGKSIHEVVCSLESDGQTAHHLL